MPDYWLRVQLSAQTLELMHQSRVARRYGISSARNGAGEALGSECTPRGTHEICERIGQGARPCSVFVARQPTGEVWTPRLQALEPHRDWILSRVLWLRGLEWGRNRGEGVDSRDRCIYIHGTPETEPIGEPRSHGCLRMRNSDVIELFDLVRVGTRVHIEE